MPRCCCTGVFRRFVDIRFAALIIGAIQVLWGLIPLMDDRDQSLFARVLGTTQFEVLWVAVSLTLGFFLVLAAVVKWRAMLLWCQALSAFAWAATFAPFRDAGVVTPVTVCMPMFAVILFGCLVREVLLGFTHRREPGRVNGISDLVERA